MTFSKAGHLTCEGMIFVFRIKLLIINQVVQNSGKHRHNIISISWAGLRFLVISLELASPVNLPHSVDPSSLERLTPLGDRLAGHLPWLLWSQHSGREPRREAPAPQQCASIEGEPHQKGLDPWRQAPWTLSFLDSDPRGHESSQSHWAWWRSWIHCIPIETKQTIFPFGTVVIQDPCFLTPTRRDLSLPSGPLSPHRPIAPPFDPCRPLWACGHPHSRSSLSLWIHRVNGRASHHAQGCTAVYRWALHSAGR